MRKDQAERLIYQIDNLEALCRDVEVGIQRIRLELQEQFRIPDPRAKAEGRA